MKKKNLLLAIIAVLLIIPITAYAVSVDIEIFLNERENNTIEVGEAVVLKADLVTTNDMYIPDEPGGGIGNESRDDITADTTWESSNTSVAIVREGKVVGVAPGTVTITGSYDKNSIQRSDSITVTVVEATENNPETSTPAPTDGEQLTDIPDTAARKDLYILISGITIAIIGTTIFISSVQKKQNKSTL